jgi:hypothetical protein
MNCRDWEERIAGDSDDPGVVRHLGDCVGCQVFASGLRQALETLRAAHADEIPEAAYTAVRARVMAELRPRRRWGWVWAVAGAALVLVAVAGVERGMRVAELPAVALRGPGAPELRAVAPRAAARKKPARKPAWPADSRRYRTEEVLVKLETGDPDVVIYWIAETKGELR